MQLFFIDIQLLIYRDFSGYRMYQQLMCIALQIPDLAVCNFLCNPTMLQDQCIAAEYFFSDFFQKLFQIFLFDRFYKKTAEIDLLPEDFLRKFVIICRHKNKPGLWTACIILRCIRYPILLIAFPFNIHQYKIICRAVFQRFRQL